MYFIYKCISYIIPLYLRKHLQFLSSILCRFFMQENVETETDIKEKKKKRFIIGAIQKVH